MYPDIESVLYNAAKYSKRIWYRIDRTRGNPKELRDKLFKILNGKFCFICGKLHKRTQLHHLADWRNYSLGNLVFACPRCHLHVLHQGSWKNLSIKLSEEIIMLNINKITPLDTTSIVRKINGKKTTQYRVAEGTWLAKGGRITERGAELFRFVEYLVGTGKSITESCRVLAEKYGVSEGSLISAYGQVRERMNDINTEVGVPTTKYGTNKHNMTYDEMLDFYIFVKDMKAIGINIVK